MDSYGLPTMGCTSSTEQSDPQPRRVLGVNELLNAVSPRFAPRPVTQQQNLTQNTHHARPQAAPEPYHIGRPMNQAGYPHEHLLPPMFLEPPQPIQRRWWPGQNRQPMNNNQPYDRGYQDATGMHFPHPQLQANWTYLPPHLAPPPPQIHHLPQHLLPAPQGTIQIKTMGTEQAASPLHPRKSCTVCLDEFVGVELVAKNFPYKCDKCRSFIVCITCLQAWFIDACRNESKMPAKCCSIIPLTAVSQFLTPEQIELYKAKFEEWRTPDRFYCPVPTCSTFIPPRLLKKDGRPWPRELFRKRRYSGKENTNPNDEKMDLSRSERARYEAGEQSHQDDEIRNSASSTEKVKSIPLVECPTCNASICSSCRQLNHPGTPCPESDIDPFLASQLEKWKIKRCPKCRAGVRRMFGCSHIECRCGAHFCFACLKPINDCDGQCEDEDYDSDAPQPMEVLEADDIDGHMVLNGTELNLGNEPYNPIVDNWTCTHNFQPLYQVAEGPSRNDHSHHNEPRECQLCWRVLYPVKPPSDKPDSSSLHLPGGISTNPGWPTTLNGEPAWMCDGQHISCQRCPKDPVKAPEWTRKYHCECFNKCGKCEAAFSDKEAAHTKAEEEKRRDTPYECYCGMVVCGACREDMAMNDMDD